VGGAVREQAVSAPESASTPTILTRAPSRLHRGRRASLAQTLAPAGPANVPVNPTRIVREYAYEGSVMAGVNVEADAFDAAWSRAAQAFDAMGDDEEYEVEKVLKTRGSDAKKEYYIRWRGYSSAADTWEPPENLTGAADLIEEFEVQQQAKKRKVADGGGGSSQDDSSDGEEDPTVSHDVKQAHWHRDVTEISKTRAPRM